MKLTNEIITLITHFESLHDGDQHTIGAQPKMCPAGIWTVGYGRALRNPTTGAWYKGEKDKATVYRMYPALSTAEAMVMLKNDLPPYEESVLRMIKRRDLMPCEYSAAVSFAYNCGTHYRNSYGIKLPFKLWSMIDRYATDDLMRAYWETSVTRGGGKVLPGLVRRRKAEAWYYTTGSLRFFQ